MADRITVGNAEIVFVLDMVPPPRASDAFFEGVTARASPLTIGGLTRIFWRTVRYSFTMGIFSFAPEARR